MRKNRAFTLIELLIVIAIIAILAAIVLVSLSSARNKATDARIASEFAQIRSAAEVYYGSNNSYAGFGCGTTDPNVSALCADITAQAGTAMTLTATANEYCGYVRLKSGNFYCVDEGMAVATLTAAPASPCVSNFDCQ